MQYLHVPKLQVNKLKIYIKMKRKPTPNQTYLNKTLIPKCQTLFRESGIKGIKFQKYLEYTYAIIRHNTEAELEDLYTIVRENLADLRGYIEKNYPNSRSLDKTNKIDRTSIESLPDGQRDYVKSLYIYKGLSEHDNQDNTTWFNILRDLAIYCQNKDIAIDEATKTFGVMTPEEIYRVISIREDLGPSGTNSKSRDNSWIKGEVDKAKKFLGLTSGIGKAWNPIILKIVWFCKKNDRDILKFLDQVAKEERTPEKYNAILEREKESASQC